MTSQIREVLLTDGEQLAMAFCPPLPTEHPRLRAVAPMRNVSRGLERIIRSTACWRGYVATWSLDKGRLFLVRVEGRYQLDGAEPLLADWFTGVLRVPRGETLVSVNMRFGSVHESELHIKVASSVVVASRTVDNRGPRAEDWRCGSPFYAQGCGRQRRELAGAADAGAAGCDFFVAGSGAPVATTTSKHSRKSGRRSEARGASLVAISPQTQPNSRKSQRDNQLGFPLLSDPGTAVADKFGLRFALPDELIEVYEQFGNDLPAVNNDPAWVLPMPARYVIGTSGLIAYATRTWRSGASSSALE